MLRDSRHPCLEMQDDVVFIPNDIEMVKGEFIDEHTLIYYCYYNYYRQLMVRIGKKNTLFTFYIQTMKINPNFRLLLDQIWEERYKDKTQSLYF